MYIYICIYIHIYTIYAYIYIYNKYIYAFTTCIYIRYSGEKTKTAFLKNISTYCLLQFYIYI